MAKYIDADKLKKEIEKLKTDFIKFHTGIDLELVKSYLGYRSYENVLSIIDSLQQERPINMIQWTGQNLREVISFTGKSPKFDEYFESWEEFEQYVHAHDDIFKLFFEDGSHYEVPVGAWIVKTPDGYNVPSIARFVHAKQEQPEVDLEKEYKEYVEDDPVFSILTNRNVGLAIAHHFAQWGAEHAPLPEDAVIFQKGVEEGRRLEMEDIMKDAVECSVYAGKEGGKWIVSYIGNYESMLKTCKGGDKVRIVIVKED